MSDDLRLNSVDRFQKNSERLVLEEHGHCEVPAGCGGVVLRWFNPNAGTPVVFRGGFADKTTIHVDEKELTSGRTILADGDHLLSIHLIFDDSPLRYFWFAGARDVPNTRGGENTFPELVSAGDGSWLASFEKGRTNDALGTLEMPEPEWDMAEFDDSAWTPLAAIEIDAESLPQAHRWKIGAMENAGAIALDLGGHNEVWIRKRFRMRRTDAS